MVWQVQERKVEEQLDVLLFNEKIKLDYYKLPKHSN